MTTNLKKFSHAFVWLMTTTFLVKTNAAYPDTPATSYPDTHTLSLPDARANSQTTDHATDHTNAHTTAHTTAHTAAHAGAHAGAHAAALDCTSDCLTTTDYQHPVTNLKFTRIAIGNNSRNNLPDLDEQPVWRHRFEIVLTQQGDSRIVFDHAGNRHVFHPATQGGYNAQSLEGGELIHTDTGYQWINDKGVAHNFRGSYLVDITYPEKSTQTSMTKPNPQNNRQHVKSTTSLNPQSLTLHYTHRRLSSVTDQLGNRIRLSYTSEGVVQLTTPDGETLRYPARYCANVAEEETEACDTQANPLPSNSVVNIDALKRHTQTSIAHLDARPASCQSYFSDYFGTERGSQIESAIKALAPYDSLTPTVRSFPIVDFVDGSRLVVLRSRDLTSSSFNDPTNPSALINRLLRDGKEIQTRFVEPLNTHQLLSHTELGNTTTIVKKPDQTVVLQLLIQQHMASASHWQQIERARVQLLARYGIQLEVVLIP